MMREHLRLRRGRGQQHLGGAVVQRLTAALQEAVVGCVLDQRVLEAIARVRRDAFDEQELRVGEPVERGAQRRLVEARHCLQQPVREPAPEHRADLRDLARRAEPVETGGERLLQRRRDRLHASLLTALEQQPRHFLDEQRNAAGAFGDSGDHLLRQGVARRNLADHARDLVLVERRERDHAVVRAQLPGRAELRPRRRDDQKRRVRAALRQRLQHVERGRIGPVQILESEHGRLGARAGEHPSRERR